MKNPLNSPDIDGNTLNIQNDIRISFENMYCCPACKEHVVASEFNDEYKLCVYCYMELAEEHNVPPFSGMDCGDVYGDR